MPYIKQSDKEAVEQFGPETPGELNFVLTRVCIRYLEKHAKGINYGTMSEVVGALECAKLEFSRRVMAPYEDKKIRLNGDVYPEELVDLT